MHKNNVFVFVSVDIKGSESKDLNKTKQKHHHGFCSLYTFVFSKTQLSLSEVCPVPAATLLLSPVSPSDSSSLAPCSPNNNSKVLYYYYIYIKGRTLSSSILCGNHIVELMGHLSSMFSGLARSFSMRKGRSSARCDGREAAEEMTKDAKKNDLILCSSGTINVDGSNNFASIFSKRGKKGVNQDCCIVWEEFGCQEDMIFCGIFDGHGPWGHFVAKRVRESMPPSLLCNWQETIAQTSLDPDFDTEEEKKQHRFNIWKHSYLKTCAAIDQELEQHRKIDSFYSGTTALSIVRQGELIVIANVGDSRAVLATTSDDGSLVPVQLTIDFKPNLPQEAQRIIQCQGRVFCLHDEPGVHRVWLPDEESPGLAMSRAFGDYCIKEYGLISVPEVTQRNISSRDQFVVLATDGVWDVISNQEAIDIVSSTPDKSKSAKCLVECAVHAWKRKRRGIAMDDISAICLFFHSSSEQVSQVATLK